MKLILITGTEDRDAITDLTLKGTEKILPKFEYISFAFNPLKNTANAQKSFEKSIKEKIRKAKIKKTKNLIIGFNLIEKIGEYYIPVVTKNFFNAINIDFVIFLKIKKRKMDKDWQRIVESYMASKLNSKIKIINVEEGNIKATIKCLRETLKIIMK